MRLALVLLALLPAACSRVADPSPVDFPSNQQPPSSATAAGEPDAGDAAQIWSDSGIDPGPGPVLTGFIARAVGVAPDDVVAAVFLLNHHSARNVVTIHVFRAGDLDAEQAAERFGASREPDCDPITARGLPLAGYPARIAHVLANDQCQPHYIVLLDEQTVAVLWDDGGYMGNDPSNLPPVPYRPIGEIELLVPWLVRELEDIELQPGGPPQNANG